MQVPSKPRWLAEPAPNRLTMSPVQRRALLSKIKVFVVIHRMKSLINGTTTAGAEIILNEEARLAREAEYYPKSELREISQHNQKPSPKLQAKPMNKSQNQRIYQPL